MRLRSNVDCEWIVVEPTVLFRAVLALSVTPTVPQNAQLLKHLDSAFTRRGYQTLNL
jgi:hypothetical protein